MPERHFRPHKAPPEEPPLRELILRCKKYPGQKFQVATYENKRSAERAVSRHRNLFKESEPNLIINSARMRDVDGWEITAAYMPPELIRG